MKQFQKGDVVRYNTDWCTYEERGERFAVLEPDFGGDKVKIGSLTTKCSLGYVEVVTSEMIERVEA